MENRTYTVNLTCRRDRGKGTPPAEMLIQVVVHDVQGLTIKSVRAVDTDEIPPQD